MMQLSFDEVQRIIGAKELAIFDLMRQLDTKNKEIEALQTELLKLKGGTDGKDSKETTRSSSSK